MPSERDKASENPYESPRSKDRLAGISASCLAVALVLLVLCVLALAACVFLWFQVDEFEFEVIGIGWSSPASKSSLASMVAVTMFVFAAFMVYLRRFSRWRSP